jgi:hypothetical protein
MLLRDAPASPAAVVFYSVRREPGRGGGAAQANIISLAYPVGHQRVKMCANSVS